MRDGRLISGPAREMLGIFGKWLVYSIFTAAVLCGIFYVLGMTGLDFILIVWASVIASSIFAVPYEENWGMKRFRILFCITACLVITSFIFLTASVLIQDILAYHLSSSYVIPAIFVSGFILAFFTRDYWSFEKLQSIKSLTVYAIFGETLVLSLGDSIAGTQNADQWVRGVFIIAILIIIALSGIAIIKLTIDERKPW